MTANLGNWLRTNWFVPLVPILLLVEWLVVRQVGGEMGYFLETVVLFDLCLFMPLLYVLCYRARVPATQLAIRAVALACLGIYIATYLVPAPLQQLLPSLGWARIVGLGVLALIELRLLVVALRLVWRPGVTATEVQAASGAPPWIARLMLIEARFWKAVWRLIRRR